MPKITNRRADRKKREVAAIEQRLRDIALGAHGPYCADWDDSSADPGISHRESSMAAVTLLLEHPEATGRDQHERWRAERIAQGWTFGPTKDFTRKTNPFLIAYEELPYVQRAKDIVRAGIVEALRPLLTGSSSGTIPMRECEHSGCSREFPDTWPWRFCPEHEPVLQIDGTTTAGNKNASYDVKAYSVENICRLLMENRCESLSVSSWGWQQDPEQFRNTWVLYVDIPQGQVSFHSPVRYEGPEYPGAWDGAHLSRERILAFCDEVMEQWRNRNQLRFPLAIAAESC